MAHAGGRYFVISLQMLTGINAVRTPHPGIASDSQKEYRNSADINSLQNRGIGLFRRKVDILHANIQTVIHAQAGLSLDSTKLIP